jgi:hypothetical protein
VIVGSDRTIICDDGDGDVSSRHFVTHYGIVRECLTDRHTAADTRSNVRQTDIRWQLEIECSTDSRQVR